MRIRYLLAFIHILIGFAAPVTAFGQTDTTDMQAGRQLIVGVHPQPPYIIKGDNGSWDGISVRLWRDVAEDMEITYRFVEITPDSASKVLLQEEVDVFLLGDVTEEADKQVDFSHIYHTAQMGAALSQTNNLSSIAKSFFSKRFWYIAAMLSVLLLIVGTIIYFVERKQNEDNFGGDRSVAEGIGSGFWWAGVTMTTIGYGDKAPITFWGRAIALVWMLIAMAVTAVLTASLVSAVMGSAAKKISVPQDLRNMKIAAVVGSGAAKYMREERVSFQEFSDLTESLEAIKKQKLDAVLHSVPALRYTISSDPDLSLQVQPVQIDPTYYAFALAPDSPLREPINLALLRVIKTPLWQQELQRFIPEKQ
ncbi:ion channel [Pontibacter cellulosilyticus]|uniref:Transporter substrate-binding domain-containing protein n=1 Tax=Pontibacter cellulosilyticus TaxID=1720253 RepID=A0A923N677_9BACT|nr:transporter substrate-binding domain-containing protein [Pontibacter cellulosilyticus]MBC5992958.1 transporter substrate-binding domain-containing protein [Pontibacter cellulosilyticus]